MDNIREKKHISILARNLNSNLNLITTLWLKYWGAKILTGNSITMKIVTLRHCPPSLVCQD